jgi:CysZ protein
MMNFVSGLFKAIGNCLKAFELLFKKGVWPFMLYQLGIWVLLWVFSIYSLFTIADYISQWLRPYLGIDTIPDGGHWLSPLKPYLAGVFGFLIAVVLKVFFWFVAGTFTKYLLLIILSPVLALLSEKTEEKLTGKKFDFSMSQLLKDIFRGIVISLRNMLFEYSIMLGCFILTLLFPPLGIVTAPFLLLAGWYFTGFTLMDYNCERHRMGVRNSVRFIRQNKGYACGIGITYSFFLALPFTMGSFIGLLFGPGICAIGSTTSFLQIKNEELKINN